MTIVNRRAALAGISVAAASGAIGEAGASQNLQPTRGALGSTEIGPRNVARDLQNPDLLTPPPTDKGLVPNLRFSFSDAHMDLREGSWSREVTKRELRIATELAAVNRRLA